MSLLGVSEVWAKRYQGEEPEMDQRFWVGRKVSGEGGELRSHVDLGLCPVSITCYVILGKSFNLSEPQFHFL